MANTKDIFQPLRDLLNANASWASGNPQKFPEFVAKPPNSKQEPKVLWIGCADSRVPESIVTVSSPGSIFVHRNIANQFILKDDSANAVLAYAVEALKVQHVIIVGHTECGGVREAFKRVQAGGTPPTATALDRWLVPMIDLFKPCKDTTDELELVKLNIKQQVQNICDTKVIQDLWGNSNPVYVHGWVYDLGNGKLRDLISVGPKGIINIPGIDHE